MADTKISRIGWLAIGIAILGGLVALFNVVQDYKKSGAIDWGHLALAVGVPLFMFAIVKSAAAKNS